MTTLLQRLSATCDQAMWEQAHKSMTFLPNEAGRQLQRMTYRDLPAELKRDRQAKMGKALEAIIPVVFDEFWRRAKSFSESENSEPDPFQFAQKLVVALKLELALEGGLVLKSAETDNST